MCLHTLYEVRRKKLLDFGGNWFEFGITNFWGVAAPAGWGRLEDSRFFSAIASPTLRATDAAYMYSGCSGGDGFLPQPPWESNRMLGGPLRGGCQIQNGIKASQKNTTPSHIVSALKELRGAIPCVRFDTIGAQR